MLDVREQKRVVQKKDLAEWEKQYHGRTAEEIARRVIARFRPSEEELFWKPGRLKKRSGVMKEGGDRVNQKAEEGVGTEPKGNDYETESDSDDMAQPVDRDRPGGTGEGVALIRRVILIAIPAALNTVGIQTVKNVRVCDHDISAGVLGRRG